ncbi:MAG: hypothetical protein SWX82_31770, partial [Cyanobacteriota bacterium]|nr:hypothetical protein [Cyanobacteriota bacterium]
MHATSLQIISFTGCSGTNNERGILNEVRSLQVCKSASVPTPNPDRGEPTPNPDRGEPTPNPDRGEPTPNPDRGEPTPNP